MGQVPTDVHNVNINRPRPIPNCKQFSNIKCVYTNCDGLVNKRSEFNFLVEKERPSIIFLTETKLSDEVINEEIFPTSTYEIYRRDRDSQNVGGGVCILVNKNLKSQQCSSDILINGCECICCEVTVGSTSILLSCMYRPPSYSHEENSTFLNQVECVLRPQSKFHQSLICGDFNAGEINWISHEIHPSRAGIAQKLYDKFHDNFHVQHVTEPTRKRGAHTPTTLDLILTKTELEIENLQHCPPLGASDHEVLLFDFVTENQTHSANICQLKFNYWKGNYIELDKFYSEHDWDSTLVGKNIFSAEKAFLKVYQSGIEKYVPKKKYQINSFKSNDKWIDRTCILLINKKKFAWNRYRRRRTKLRYEYYCKIRNEVTTKLRETKKNYEKQISKEAKRTLKLYLAI